MAIYRVINNISPEAASRMSPEYNGYSVLTCDKEGDVIWKPIKPSLELMSKQPWYRPFTFFDPNEINEKMGLPPNYIALERGKDIIKHLKSIFTIKRILKDDNKDFCFEGDYNVVSTGKN